MLKLLIIPLIVASLSANAEDQMYGMSKVNETRFSWMFWDVYDIGLYAPDGDYQSSKPVALELTYLTDLDKDDIVDRSCREMRRQKAADEVTLVDWHTQMEEIFPDVKKGDKLVGVATPAGASEFYHNGKKVGEVKDPEFTKAFFNIWLGDKTSEPELRQSLLKK